MFYMKLEYTFISFNTSLQTNVKIQAFEDASGHKFISLFMEHDKKIIIVGHKTHTHVSPSGLLSLTLI